VKIAMIAAALPPQLDGIGDYTANLAAAIAGSRAATVKILAGADRPCAAIPGVTVEPAFSPARPSSVWRIARGVAADRPDWILLQYNPFSYGRWGLNLHLPLALRAIKMRCPATRLAVMVHEPFVPVSSVKNAVMTTWQRAQLWLLGRGADVVFFSIQPWAQRFRRWFPGRPVLHLPVGSNILPIVPITRAAARSRLDIPEDTAVLGLFGAAHAGRMLDWVGAAARAARRSGRDTLVLYVGPRAGVVRAALGDVPVLAAEGPLPAPEVSRRLSAVDIYLAPFVDGVSTRRTSLMTGLQHGLATVGTRGFLTDPCLRDQDGRAFLLADMDGGADAFAARVLEILDDAPRRARLGDEAERLYRREFDWEPVAARLTAALNGERERKAIQRGPVQA
jgi:glycosyltransferase involved in cell wall biosynthesis